ncbi:MAG: S8 family peptidase [Chitinophagaceae bacterium]
MNRVSSKKYSIVLLRRLLLMLCFLFTQLAYSQQKLPGHKISPGLLQRIKSGIITGKSKFIITISGNILPNEIKILNAEEKKINDYGDFSFFEIRITVDELLSKVILAPNLIFVEDASRTPNEELLISNLDLSANKINLVHRKFSQWNGDGITVSVKENKPDTTDIDFKGRFITTNLASAIVSSHASIMSTLIAGGGNSWHLGKGAAWGSTISSSNFATLLPDALSAYQQYNISVQNHSYGVGIENFYGADAAAYDATVFSNPSLLHFFSSGNSGTSASTTGVYSGLTKFANLTGSFKMAKNSIAVGATDSFGVVAAISSKGPAHDGRVKPELVAFGEDGSSGSAALASGTALILQHSYKQLNGSLPASSLIKAVLINSADDVGNKEVDYANGYGSLNALNAVKTFQLSRFMNGSVSHSATQLFNVSVPAGIKKLKVTLVWIDPPALPNAVKALVNDLDLELAHTVSGQTWKPWVLSRFPHPDSLQQLAGRKKDSLNNVEQVTIENPVAGNYEFRVTGFNVNTSSQNFHIAYQFDSVDIFEWHFPGSNDFVLSSAANTIRWASSFAASAGLLEYSVNNGINWQTIEGAVNLATGYYKWNTPAVTSNALLRMTVSGKQHTSDTFTISRRTATGVGFNCPDSFLFYWSKIPGINNYRVYKLGNRYLEPITATTDSFIVLAKNINPSLHFAVAPLIGNREGMKSYTFNYTTQGVECYIRSFLSSLLNNTAALDLLLGTIYGINRIVLEKFDGISFVAIQQVTNPTGVLNNFSDAALKKGLNIYRIKLELTGGGVIYSQQETVYYLSGNDFVVYPNPVQQNQPINILTSDSPEETRLIILNTQGSKIAEYIIENTVTTVPTGRLSKGIYIFRFMRGGQKDNSIKVFIY